MELMDSLALLMFLMGVLLGASQKLVRVIMSTFIAALTLVTVPALYQGLGRFIAALLQVPRARADALGFLLAALVFIIILELVTRRLFEGTLIPRLGVFDQILGALVGLVWGVLVAGVALMPLAYIGTVSTSSPIIAFMQSLFKPFGLVLRLLYPVGFAPLIDFFIA